MTDINPEKSLKYLAHTDEECAKAKAYMKGCEQRLKTIKAMCWLGVVDVPQGQKEQMAYNDARYKGGVEAYENSVADYEILNNKRNTAMLAIEVWRSMNAAQKKGNIV